MQHLITRQARSPLSLLSAWLLLIGVIFVLASCSSSSRGNCGVALPTDVSVQVANGITYLGGLGSVRAVRADGSQLWQAKVGGDASPMILDHSQLFVISGTTLTTLRAADGAQLWQFQGVMSRSTPLVADGTVYVASPTAISAVRSRDGKLLWNYPLTTANIPPLALENQVLYVGSNTLTVALQSSDGKLLWMAQQPAFSLQVMNGEVFTYAISTAAALRSSDGKLLWSFDLHTTSGAQNSTITPTASGNVYINTSDTLYALQARDGKQLWSTPASGQMKPVIVGNTLYMLTPDNHPAALKSDDGTLLWKSPSLAYQVVASANDGTIYADGQVDPGSQNSTVFALKMSDGSRLWMMSNASGKPQLIQNGIVYFVQWNISCQTPLTAEVYALQTRNGKDLWHLHLQP